MDNKIDIPQLSIKTNFELVIRASRALRDALKSCTNPQVSADIPLESLDDELELFRLWASTNGAHRAGRASLDHKLRLSSSIQDKVIADLKELTTILKRGMCLI